jgi:hypothetical protein
LALVLEKLFGFGGHLEGRGLADIYKCVYMSVDHRC